MRVVVVEDEPLFRELLCTGLTVAMNDVEIVRARNALWNELMAVQSASDVMQ